MAGCCAAASDCDDANPCTLDGCDFAANTCLPPSADPSCVDAGMPPSDGGVAPDAGTMSTDGGVALDAAAEDAAVVALDGSVIDDDGGMTDDAGRDDDASVVTDAGRADAATPDASAERDAGTSAPADDGGCGCRIAPHADASGPGALAAFALLALVGAVRRRTRRALTAR